MLVKAHLPKGEQWFRFQATDIYGRPLSVDHSAPDLAAARAIFERIYAGFVTEYSVVQ